MKTMKRGSVIAFSIFACVVFVSVMGVTAARIVSGKNAAEDMALKDFSRLTRLVVSAWEMSGGAGTDTFRRQVRAFYDNSPRLAFVCAYSRKEGPLYVIPKVSSFTMASRPEWDGEPPLSYEDYSVKRLTVPLNVGNTVGTNLTALYVTLSDEDLYLIFRDSALAMCVFMLLAVLFLGYAYLGKPDSSRDAVAEAGKRAAGAGDYLPDFMDAPVDDTVVPLRESIVPSGSPSMSEDFQVPDLDMSDFPDESGLSNPGDYDDPFGAESDLPSPEDFDTESLPRAPYDDLTVPQVNPEGLYSPASGCGWNQYLKERLQAELSRAASFEQDLVLALFDMERVSKESMGYSAMAKTVISFFSFRDLAFEHGDSGFAVILPNRDISRSLRMVDDFIKKVESQLGSSPTGPTNIHAGLSARAGRIVGADRMIEEAEKALEKSKADENARVVAFKPDPDNYREYIACKD